MTTFNAGSIDAKLTLDRSSFTRELREARAQAERFESDPIHLGVNVDAASLTYLRERIDMLDGRTINVRLEAGAGALYRLEEQIRAAGGQVDVDVEVTGLGKLSNLQRRINLLQGQTIEVDVDVTGLGRLSNVQRRINELSDQVIDILIEVDGVQKLQGVKQRVDNLDGRSINVDLDVTGTEDLVSAAILIHNMPATINVDLDAGSVHAQLAAIQAHVAAVEANDVDIDIDTHGLPRGLGHISRMQAIIAGILILAPLLPAALGPGAAAIGGLAAAISAAAAGAAVLGAGLGGAVLEFIKAKRAGDPLTGGLKVMDDALNGVKSAWDGFINATKDTSFALIAEGLGILEDMLPRLVPIFDAFAGVAFGALDSIGEFMEGPRGARMLTFFEEFGSQSFGQILAILGNLLQFFGMLFEAFGPFATNMLAGLEDITAGWADWADGLGQTQGFIDFINYANEMGPRVLDMLGSLFDAFISLGKALAPLAGPALTAFTGLFDLIANAPTGVLTALIVIIGGLYLAFIAVNAAVAIWNGLVIIWAGISGVASGIMTVWTAAVWLFNAAWAANPIGVVIIAIIALVAGLIWAYNHFETFRNIVDAVVNWVVNAFKWLANILVGHSIIPDMINGIIRWFNLMTAPIRAVIGIVRAVISTGFSWIANIIRTYLNVAKAIISGVWAAIKVIFSAAIAIVKAVVTGNFRAIPGIIRGALGQLGGIARSTISNMVGAIRDGVGRALDIFRGLPGRIRSAVGSLGSVLIGAGRAIISGLIRGISDMFGSLRSKLSAVTSLIPDWKGPAERDAELLRPSGRLVMGGFIGGLEDQIGPLERSLGRITNRIAAAATPDFGGAGGAGNLGGTLAGVAAAGKDVTINLHSYNPVAERTSETAVREVSTLGALGVFA